MNQTLLNEAAQAIFEAGRTLKPISPLTEKYPDITVNNAYRIQLLNIERYKKEGATIVGKKIGLTSRGMQQMLGVREPDYGHLLDQMIVEEEAMISLSRLLQPRIEAEIAFILKEKLSGPGVTLSRVLQATEGVMPAFEIIDSRIKDWKIKIQDTIADNASSALVILGNQMCKPDNINLKYIGLVLECNGVILDTAAGAEVMGHPALSVAWLANKLAQYKIALHPGEIILSGSLTKAYEIKSQSVFNAYFGVLGHVKAVFG